MNRTVCKYRAFERMLLFRWAQPHNNNKMSNSELTSKSRDSKRKNRNRVIFVFAESGLCVVVTHIYVYMMLYVQYHHIHTSTKCAKGNTKYKTITCNSYKRTVKWRLLNKKVKKEGKKNCVWKIEENENAVHIHIKP